MSCIGTAGHVDHGKSTLVEALTGIDPDRLVEEKERGMTIDLGFAWLTLPSGREVSIVDVPGHENFIKNMLAGVGGIDAALLVIAADEGVMPQTREHLAILDLLGVSCGVIALTKVDLVDEEWLSLVQEEVAELLRPTRLAEAPLIPVSAHNGQGLPELLAALDRILARAQSGQDIARPRLPIDRVFTLTGFGTIVTGTLLDGSLKVGQEVEILPQGLPARIRNIQMHKRQTDLARPGGRTALNLPNIAKQDLARGNVLGLPGQLRITRLCDVRLTLLGDAPRPLTHNTAVDFYCGAQEIPARVRLLDCDELQPGKQAWAQLRLERPAVVTRRERFIIRIPSPAATIGGGEIVEVQARYHRRHQPAILADLERLAGSSPEEMVLAILDRERASGKAGGGPIYYEASEIARRCNLASSVTHQVLKSLITEGRVCTRGGYWFAQHTWETLVRESLELVSDYHRDNPLRSGISREEWRARLSLTPKLATELLQVLQEEGQLEPGGSGTLSEGGGMRGSSGGSLIRLPGFSPSFTAAQRQQVAALLQRFSAQPSTPPDRTEAEALVGPDVLNALIEQGRLVKVGVTVLFLRETYEESVSKLVAYLRAHESLTAAEARDVLGTTRKYILPLLEHLDSQRITRRQGDLRTLGPNAPIGV
jgi:selenocysteine-specific elongation factor